MNKQLLALIIGYFDANKGVNLVSKYWKTIAYENRDRKLNNTPQSIFFLENDHIEKIKLLMIKNKSSKKVYVDATDKYKEEDNYVNERKRYERKWEKKIYRKAKRNLGNLKNGNNNNSKIKNNSSNDSSTKKVKWGSVESSTDQSDYNNQNNNSNTLMNEGIQKQGSIDENEFINIALSSSSESVEEEESTYVEDTTPKITIRSRNNDNNNYNNEIEEEEEEMNYRRKERREINYISKKFDNLSNDVVMNTSYNSSPQRENQQSQSQFSPKGQSSNSSKLNSSTPTQSIPVEKVKKLYKDEIGYDDLVTEEDNDDDSYMTDYDHLLVHVREIRSESQLTSLISYIQDGYISIENSDNEKRKLKKVIRGTCRTFSFDPISSNLSLLYNCSKLHLHTIVG